MDYICCVINNSLSFSNGFASVFSNNRKTAYKRILQSDATVVGHFFFFGFFFKSSVTSDIIAQSLSCSSTQSTRYIGFAPS